MFRKFLNFYAKTMLHTRFKYTWKQAEGYDTGVKIYNCISKTKVPLIVRNKDQISWYTCGPTVYSSAHLGHASCYVKLDIIQRILKRYFKLNLVTVMNITDIDDKIIKKSIELSVPGTELTRKFETEFWDDIRELNVVKPDVIIRVTEQIPTILKIINHLIKEGNAYERQDGIYFNLFKNKELYGKLASVTINDEENVDFALWKPSKPDEPFWTSEWGPGRPGWHTECSAIASAVFGNHIDIHAGGIDLRFPHHENEEAISCSYHGIEQWVANWLHTGHLNLVGDNKMSKSLNNCVNIRSLVEDKKCEAFRMACAMSHYRAAMEYSADLIQTAEAQLNKFESFLEECNVYLTHSSSTAVINSDILQVQLSQAKLDINAALKDDFNTSRVIKTLTELVSTTNKMFQSSASSEPKQYTIIVSLANFIREHLDLFGFTSFVRDSKLSGVDSDSNKMVDSLIEFRENVRQIALQTKDRTLLQYCDKVRDELKSSGIKIKDRTKLRTITKLK